VKNTNKDKKSQHERLQDSQIPLTDVTKSGKERPWRKHKDLSSAVSRAFLSNPDLVRYGEAVRNCGSSLTFSVCPSGEHGKSLVEAFFCKCRLCTMCQWRKSLAIQKQVLDLAHWHLEERKTDVPLLLTLTVPNVPGRIINQTIDQMNAAWTKMMRRKVVDRSVVSWARFFEITRNKERDDYHPHYHVLLMVSKKYFERASDLYIHRDEWLRLWQESMGDDRITQVDIRTAKKRKNGELEALVAEVAKYATKPFSYIEEDENGEYRADPNVVEELYYALKGRRLVGFGGLFKKIRKEKKLVDVENADLVAVEEEAESVEEKKDKEGCKCEVCELTLIHERYLWNSWVRNFFMCKRVEKRDEKFDDSG
jgi:plasmid rolling circle replication initiator protein Rep